MLDLRVVTLYYLSGRWLQLLPLSLLSRGGWMTNLRILICCAMKSSEISSGQEDVDIMFMMGCSSCVSCTRGVLGAADVSRHRQIY